MEKVTELFIRMQCMARAFLQEERGDTNFISIIVILGIVLVVAGAFMAFKDQVMAWFSEQIPDFLQ